MGNAITSKQVIEFLVERKEIMEQELLHLENTLKMLADLNKQVRQSNPFKLADKKEEKRGAIGSLKSIKLKPEDRFDPNAKLDKKISYVLGKIGNGFKENIIEELLTYEPNLDPYKLEKAIAVRLSYLLKIGAIQGRKFGRRYEYTLLK